MLKPKLNRVIPALLVALLCCATQRASAAVMLGLTTTADLNNLQIGSPVSFDVVLSNIADSSTGDLDALGATLDWDASLLGTPIIADGAIIPDATGIVAIGRPGIIDYLYDMGFAVFSFASLTNNGTFFSFTVTPQAVGSGAISFFAASGLNSDPNVNFVVPVSFNGPLAYQVRSPGGSGGSGGIVPEPTSGMIWCALACLAAVPRRRA